MTFVMSNIHGCYTQFVRMLELINFKKSDALFILGDMVGYGDESLDLINDLSVRDNVWTIAGEEDRRAYRILARFDELLRSGEAPDDEYREAAMKWASAGGQKIMLDFGRRPAEEREGILEYLGDLPGFDTANVCGRDFLLVHSGISGYRAGRDLYDYDETAFCADDGLEQYPGMTVVCGHRPTTEFYDKSGKIYEGKGFIAVDCGAARGGCLGCLCLDNMEKTYVY